MLIFPGVNDEQLKMMKKVSPVWLVILFLLSVSCFISIMVIDGKNKEDCEGEGEILEKCVIDKRTTHQTPLVAISIVAICLALIPLAITALPWNPDPNVF